MSQNPFDPQNPLEALGGGEGGFDMNALLEQASQMQQQLQDAQEQLANRTVEGTVAGGSVTVTVDGVGGLRSVDIRAGGFDGNDADDLADLGDMIVAAWRDAKNQADAMANEALGPLAGGLGGEQGPGQEPGQGQQGPGQLGFGPGTGG